MTSTGERTVSRLKRLIVEIHQRSVWQALVVYLGAGYAVLEGAALFRDEFGLPGWLLPVALVLLLIGLPVVVVISLARAEVYGDEVPAGDVEAAAEEDRRLRLLTWRTAGLIFVGALALWGVIAAGLLLTGTYERVTADERRSIAVLPFENLSPDPDETYFADGIHDEVISQLGKIAALRVTSRTSVMEFRDQQRNLKEIAERLGVASILEGTVRRAGDRVRITTQLIDARADEHLWAESYERDITDIFAIQADIARRVAAALRARLLPDELARIETQPTDNVQAYEYYLRGREYAGRSYYEQDVRSAIHMFETAVQLDPDFALAWAHLGMERSELVWSGHARREDELPGAAAAIDSAVKVDPGLPEAHLARGWYHYRAENDYEKALEDFRFVQKQLPSRSDVLFAIGAVLRRLGQWEESVDAMESAVQLEPTNIVYIDNLGVSYLRMRQYGKAEETLLRTISLAPDYLVPYRRLAWVYLNWRGDTDAAWEVLARPRGARARVDMVTESIVTFDINRALLRIFHDEFKDALAELTLLSCNGDRDYYTAKAEMYSRMGEQHLARVYFDSVRAIWEPQLEVRPALVHRRLAMALAGLGLGEEAVQHARAAAQLEPFSQDAMRGVDRLWLLAETYLLAGDYDGAIGTVEQVLSVPSRISAAFLQVDPLWSPLRADPRFQAMLAKYYVDP